MHEVLCLHRLRNCENRWPSSFFLIPAQGKGTEKREATRNEVFASMVASIRAFGERPARSGGAIAKKIENEVLKHASTMHTSV